MRINITWLSYWLHRVWHALLRSVRAVFICRTVAVVLCVLVNRENGRITSTPSLKSRSVVGGTLMSRGAGHSYAPYKKPAMEVRSKLRLCSFRCSVFPHFKVAYFLLRRMLIAPSCTKFESRHTIVCIHIVRTLSKLILAYFGAGNLHRKSFYSFVLLAIFDDWKYVNWIKLLRRLMMKL